MAQRTVALWRDPATNSEVTIGIESIFTVINGKQINIPGKVEELREKGRRNELFCPCGCGLNLILVAGDRGLREQHFRVKSGQEESEEKCNALTESIASLNSKIVIKCWLDEILRSEIKTRVPISEISDSTRKFELTFLSPQKKVAVCFWHTREDISDEKLGAIEEYAVGLSTFFIVSSGNITESEQYPEWLQKIVRRQRYCLSLHAPSPNYNEASMSVFIYEKDERGIWHTLLVCDAKLSEYSISNGRLLHFISDVEDLAERTRNDFLSDRLKRNATRQLPKVPPKQEINSPTDAASNSIQRKGNTPDSSKAQPMSLSDKAIMMANLMNKRCECGGKPILRGIKYYCNLCGKLLLDPASI